MLSQTPHVLLKSISESAVMCEGGGGSIQSPGNYTRRTTEHELVIMANTSFIMTHIGKFIYRGWQRGGKICEHKAQLCMHLVFTGGEGVMVIRKMEANCRENEEDSMVARQGRRKRETVPKEGNCHVTQAQKKSQWEACMSELSIPTSIQHKIN